MFEPLDEFAPRHIGPRDADRKAMLEAVRAASLDALIDEAIPERIRLTEPLRLPPSESESAYLARLEGVARRNQVFRSFIGLGYHDTLTPPVIQRRSTPLKCARPPANRARSIARRRTISRPRWPCSARS